MDNRSGADRSTPTDVEGQMSTTTPVNRIRPHINYGGTERLSDRLQPEAFGTKDDDIIELSLSELLELKRYDAKEIVHVIRSRFGTTDELCRRLRTDSNLGLDDLDEKDLLRRREKYGSNVIPPQPTKSFFRFLWEAAQDTTLIILTIAAILSFALSFYQPNSTDIVTTGNLTERVVVEDETDADKSERTAGWIEAIGILLAVIIIILVTAFVNWSKDLQFRGLQDRLTCQHNACVIRSGKRKIIPVEDLVVGDICVLSYGDVIPADGLLLLSADLKIDESSHTGESEEVHKTPTTDPILFSGTHVKEGGGRMVVTGVGIHSAKGIIISLMGVSFNDENNPEEKRSLLHKKLERIALSITYAGTAIAIATFLILVIRFCIETFVVKDLPWQREYFHELIRFLIISITLLAVAVPEGLPLAVILALAYSVKKMMADNNLVRHLDACETMGSATTILCDKTGTLTANKMTVVQSYVAGSVYSRSDELQDLPLELRSELSTALAVNTNYSSQLGLTSSGSGLGSGLGSTCGGIAIGSKTECALLEFIESMGQDYKDIRKLYPEQKHIHVYPFNSDRKWMGTVIRFRSPGSATASAVQEEEGKSREVHRLLVKGAAEIVINRCEWIVGEKCRIEPMSEDSSRKREANEVIDAMTNHGLRTLCIAYKDFVSSGNVKPYEDLITADLDWRNENVLATRLVCLAIVGIEDPVRPEVEDAVARCQGAGVVVRMITGDNLQTARFVAYKSGIISPVDRDTFLTIDGPTFNRMIRKKPDGPVEQELMDEVWPRLRVLARSTPQDKYTLVKGIMDSRLSVDREVVAVTGDGTNDGPALKKAHVGFAMGISGTDVAKEASDIILIDDNFASIIKAVVWGRHIYDSIAKFLQFQLTVNIVAVIMALVGACIVMDSPLKGAQMLWVNLLMDTLASLSLATERPSEEVLNRRPYGCSQALVSHRMLLNILAHACYELAVLLSILFCGAGLLDIEDGRSEWLRGLPSVHYTMIFNAFVMMILFNEICARKLDNSLNLFGGLHRAPLFMAIWLTSFAAQIIIIQWGGAVFSTARLTISQWAWCLLFGITDLLYGFLISLLVRICSSLKNRRKSRTSYEDFEKSMFDKSLQPYELLTIETNKAR